MRNLLQVLARSCLQRHSA